MKTLILTIATAALLSATTFGSTAEAGGKKFRMNGFNSHNQHNRSFKRRKLHALHQARLRAARKAKLAAARKAKIAQIRKAKIAAARKAKIAQIRRAKVAAAKKAKIANERRIAARLAAAERREQEENNVKDAEIVEAEKVAGVSATVPTSTTDANYAYETDQDSDYELSCKKFIPGAGMTITVPCQS